MAYKPSLLNQNKPSMMNERFFCFTIVVSNTDICSSFLRFSLGFLRFLLMLVEIVDCIFEPIKSVYHQINANHETQITFYCLILYTCHAVCPRHCLFIRCCRQPYFKGLCCQSAQRAINLESNTRFHSGFG